MHNKELLKIITIASVISLGAGCAVRTYTITKEKVDQNLNEGNQGYMQGTPPAVDPNRSTTREISVVELEIGKARVSKNKTKKLTQTIATNSALQENTNEPAQTTEAVLGEPKTITYVVQKNDTLEKIAARPEIYGDAKKWFKIFKANEDSLKSPNKIYPGQTIKIEKD
jgi:nucleoid-associated protein YgaU